jgi:hypothetical protein
MSAAASVLMLLPLLFYGLYLTRDISRLTIARQEQTSVAS